MAPTKRADGWQGGRPDTWQGHYLEAAALRLRRDPQQVARDPEARAAAAAELRRRDAPLASVPAAVSRRCRPAPGVPGVSLEPLSATIGTVIHGVDLAALRPGEARLVWDTLLERRVVFFRGQGHVTREQHIAFARHFGECGLAFGETDRLAKPNSPQGFPEILSLNSDERSAFLPSNWHADVTWHPRPPMGSILLCRTCPPVGGDTIFADVYAMWQGLSQRVKAALAGRRAAHGRGRAEEVQHPVCVTHPETGGETLYVNPTFTQRLCGMSAEESARLLPQLYMKMYATPEYQCRFRWEEGSVAFWDNRACQHYAVGDVWPHVRRMERVTILDRNHTNRAPAYQPAAAGGSKQDLSSRM